MKRTYLIGFVLVVLGLSLPTASGSLPTSASGGMQWDYIVDEALYQCCRCPRGGWWGP